MNQAPLRVPMDWELDNLVVAEVEEVFHDLSDSVQFHLSSRALLELGHYVFCTLNELPSFQLFVHEFCKAFVN